MVWLLISNSVAHAYPVPPLPEDNLVVNPWFRSTSDPKEAGFDGWTVLQTDGVTWNLSQKESNPSPDIVVSGRCGHQSVYCGTAARWADQEGVLYPNIDVFMYQVVAADPSNRLLKFFTHFVSHRVDVGAVNVYGGQSPDGPWELAWVPLYHTQTQLIKPDSGAIRDLWLETGFRERILEQGYPYYKIELQARVPELKNDFVKGTGFKITGIYFTAAFTDQQGEASPPQDGSSASPTLTPVPGTAGTTSGTPAAAPERPSGSEARGTETPGVEAEAEPEPTMVAEAPGAGMTTPILVAEALSATEIVLRWDFGTVPGRMLRLERSSNGETDWRRVASIEPTVSEYIDDGLSPDTVHHYRVRVTQNDSSNVVSIRTLPAPPQPLAPPEALQIVPDAAAQQIELRWRDPLQDETGFEIERSLDGINFTVIETVARDVSSFIDEGLNPANYYYRVRSVRDGEYSGFSEIVQATLANNAPEVAEVDETSETAVDTSAAGASTSALAGQVNMMAIGLVGLFAFLAGMVVILVIVKRQKPTSEN